MREEAVLTREVEVTAIPYGDRITLPAASPVISGGEKVHPWEVETVLMDHPDIVEAAVLGVPDPEFGQRLSAFIVTRSGCELSRMSLDAWLTERVARYQRPRDVTFRDTLPITPVGKLDRRALRASLEVQA